MRAFLISSLLLVGAVSGHAENAAASAQSLGPSSASVVFSLVRLLGSLALVLALFFLGIYVFKNWQRLLQQRGGVVASKLRVLETKSLGSRHALYVVGYERQRLLLSSSPNGVTLLTTLPESEDDAAQAAASAPAFSEVLMKVLNKK